MSSFGYRYECNTRYIITFENEVWLCVKVVGPLLIVVDKQLTVLMSKKTTNIDRYEKEKSRGRSSKPDEWYEKDREKTSYILPELEEVLEEIAQHHVNHYINKLITE